MVVYQLFLTVKDSKEKAKYALDLKLEEENNPEKLFTRELCENMQRSLQKQSDRLIKNNQLEKIIKTWIEDIKEGYRQTDITLELPLLIESNLEGLEEEGNLEPPSLISPNLSEIEPGSGMLPPLETLFGT